MAMIEQSRTPRYYEHRSGNASPPAADYSIEVLRLVSIISSLVAFSCIASINGYESKSSLTFACVVAVFLWLWLMGMFAIEILINRFQSFAINEAVFKTLIRGGDGLFFLLIYSATIATSVIKTDASENFVADQSKLNAACVFLWFVSFSMFGHLFIMEDGFRMCGDSDVEASRPSAHSDFTGLPGQQTERR